LGHSAAHGRETFRKDGAQLDGLLEERLLRCRAPERGFADEFEPEDGLVGFFEDNSQLRDQLAANAFVRNSKASSQSRTRMKGAMRVPKSGNWLMVSG